MIPSRNRRVLPLPALAGIVLAALLLAACNSASERVQRLPPAETLVPGHSNGPVELVESGFHWDGQFVYYAFTVKNPGPEQALEETVFQVSFYGNGGEPLGSDSGKITIIWPGETVAEASQLPMSHEPGHMEVSLAAQRQQTLEEPANVAGFEQVEGIYEEAPFGGRVLALIENPFGRDLEDLRVTAVLYDGGDNVIAGGSGFLDLLPGSGRAVAQVIVLGSLPEPPARVVVYTTFSARTLQMLR